ncbi:MAG: hypothetical protein M3P96_01700, partial [Actinomycetota bacterium]|nr:hypothetical protein [Actinomycetota bacterium]
VQGGALVDAAAAAAERALGVLPGGGAALVDAHHTFLRPADAALLEVRGLVLRHGRRNAVVEARVLDGEVLVGLGLYGFVLTPGPAR